MNSIYDFSLENQNGEEIPLSHYQGKVLIVVNTATGCGLTPQYQGLQDLYLRYQEKGLEILASVASTTRPPSHDSLKPRSMVKKPFLSMTGLKAKLPGHWANASNGTLQNLSSTDKAKLPNASPPKQSQLPWKT